MNLKSKYRVLKENIKYIISDHRFKLIILFMICFNFIGSVYMAYNLDYIDGFIRIYTDSYYTSTFLALMLFNMLNTYNMYEKNTSYIIRFKTKKEYLNDMMKKILISNTILFFINFMVCLIFLNFFGGNLVFKNYSLYNIPNTVYTLFYLTRFFIVSSVLSIINMCVLKLFNSKLLIVANLIIWISFIFFPSTTIIIDKIYSMPILIHEYFRIRLYSNIFLELACSIIYIGIMYIIFIILYKIANKYMKQIGD